jgi:hypothetical protein
MIIGLSGYMKSGKDTVGQMIIDLTMQKNHKLVEDEFGRTIPGENGGPLLTEPDYPLFEIRKFAGKLKQVASLMTGIPVEKFEDQDFKDGPMPEGWDTTEILVSDKEPPYPHKTRMTVREFLQKLGTQAVRHHVHQDAWVISAMAGMKNEDNVIFTDCRFPNEAQAIKDKGGVIIRISREVPGVSQKFIDRSESEVSLDDWKFDYTIHNMGTLEDLRNQVKEILKRINKVNLVNT